MTCPISVCDFDSGLCDIGDDDAFSVQKRGGPENHFNILEARGRGRPFKFDLLGLAAIVRSSRPYPGRGQLFATRLGLANVLRRWFRMRGTRCDDTGVDEPALDLTQLPSSLPTTGETEHPVDVNPSTLIASS